MKDYILYFLQSNHHNSQSFGQMITDDFWETMIQNIKKYDDEKIYEMLKESCIIYNVEIPQMIKQFIDYYIKKKTELLTEKILTLFTYIVHNISTKKEINRLFKNEQYSRSNRGG